MILFFAIFAFLFLVAALCVGLGQAFLVSRQNNRSARCCAAQRRIPAGGVLTW